MKYIRFEDKIARLDININSFMISQWRHTDSRFWALMRKLGYKGRKGMYYSKGTGITTNKAESFGWADWASSKSDDS